MLTKIEGESVLSALAIKIDDSLGPDELKAIYKNRPLQGMQTPSVFLHQINAEHTNEMGTRGNRSYMVDIRVHPDPNETRINTWANTLAEKLCSAVNTIVVGGLLTKARNINWRVESDVLHIIVSYQFKVNQRITVAETLMATLNHRERVK